MLPMAETGQASKVHDCLAGLPEVPEAQPSRTPPRGLRPGARDGQAPHRAGARSGAGRPLQQFVAALIPGGRVGPAGASGQYRRKAATRTP